MVKPTRKQPAQDWIMTAYNGPPKRELKMTKQNKEKEHHKSKKIPVGEIRGSLGPNKYKGVE